MYRIVFKSPFDICGALFGLFLLSPVLLIIAVLIRIQMGSPVLFKQERLGKNGKIFKIFKFRTMIDNAITMGTGLRTDAKDPRVTKIGNFLRKTSLDELPQLFNILRGEMSFIGPRPPMPYHPYKYEDYDETQKKRFLIRPGISGYAQVIYRTNASWEDRISMDVFYVENISFFFDLHITWLTIVSIISKRNIFPDENRIKDIDKELETNRPDDVTNSDKK